MGIVPLLIAVLVFILAIWIIFKILKAAAKFALTVIMVILIIAVCALGFAQHDLNKFSEDWELNKLVLLRGDTIIAGYESEPYRTLTEEELAKINSVGNVKLKDIEASMIIAYDLGYFKGKEEAVKNFRNLTRELDFEKFMVGYKKGQIQVAPERFSLRFIKYSPLFLSKFLSHEESFVENVKENLEQDANTVLDKARNKTGKYV